MTMTREQNIELTAAIQTVCNARKFDNIVDFDVEYLMGYECFSEDAPEERVIQISFRLSSSNVLKKFLDEEKNRK